MGLLPLLLSGLLLQPPTPPPSRPTKEGERRLWHPPVKGAPPTLRDRATRERLALREASFFNGIKWRNIGPTVESGRVIDIVQRGDKIFVAYATGGLWITEDDGTSMRPIFDDQASFGIGAIAVTPDAKTIWVGTGEANSQRTSYAGDGVYKSTDGGKTWRNVGLPESHHIGKILLDPKNPDVAYVAAMGHLYSQNPERGVYKTTDGGKTWRHVLKVDDATGAIDLVIDPRNPNVLMASMWDRDRRAWNIREAGKGSAVYRTENGGASWSKVTSLPVGEAAGRTGLALCEANPKVVYAFVDNQADDEFWREADDNAPGGVLTPARFLRLTDDTLKALDDKVLETFLKRVPGEALKPADLKTLGVAEARKRIEARDPDFFRGGLRGSEVYRSVDGGRTFTLRSRGPLGGYYWGRVFVHPANPDEVMVTGVPLLRSRDGGVTWESIIEDAHVDHHALVWDERDARRPFRRLWAGHDGGFSLSADDGKSSVTFNKIPVGQATTIALDDERPYNVYLGFQDNGTQVGPSTHVPGRNVTEWQSIFGGDGSAIAVDPRPGRREVYVAYQFGEHYYMDRDRMRGGAAFGVAPANPPVRRITPPNPKGLPSNRFNWISPIAIDPFVPDVIYIGSQYLFRSFDQGRKWERISPDLTKNHPYNAQGSDVPFSTLKEISVSPLKFGLILCGADDGRVTYSPDGGDEWRDIPTPTPDKWVSRVIASRHDANVFYVSQSGYREDDWNAYLYRSDDRGKTWRSIVGNLPPETINVIREDPKEKDTLYVGTDAGVYVSRDAGKSWAALQGGLLNTPVHDMAIQERADDLVIATHARSAFVLPLKPLRLLTDKVLAGPVKILDATDLRARRDWGYEDRGQFIARPADPKLRLTVFVPTAGQATVTLRDKDGRAVLTRELNVVKGYNALETSLRIREARPITGKSSTDPAKTVEDALRDANADFRAQYVPPGEYKLEVSLNGQTDRVDWRLREPE